MKKTYFQIFSVIAFGLFVLTIPFAGFGFTLWFLFYIACLAMAAFAMFIAAVLFETNRDI